MSDALEVSIRVDATQAMRDLDDIGKRQVPFAMAQAINGVVNNFQRAEFAGIESRFHIRRPGWVKKSIKRTHKATKSELWADVAIQPPGAKPRADILGKFERDTSKTSVRPGGDVAVPMPGGPNRNGAGIVANRDRPRAFHFHQVGGAIEGERGTFIVQGPNGEALILQRQKGGARRRRKGDPKRLGPAPKGPSHVRLLYVLLPQVPISPVLEFVATAQRVVNETWAAEADRALASALATAR